MGGKSAAGTIDGAAAGADARTRDRAPLGFGGGTVSSRLSSRKVAPARTFRYCRATPVPASLRITTRYAPGGKDPRANSPEPSASEENSSPVSRLVAVTRMAPSGLATLPEIAPRPLPAASSNGHNTRGKTRLPVRIPIPPLTGGSHPVRAASRLLYHETSMSCCTSNQITNHRQPPRRRSHPPACRTPRKRGD